MRSLCNSNQSLDVGQPNTGADPNRLMVSGIGWEQFYGFFTFLISLFFITRGVELLLVVIYL